MCTQAEVTLFYMHSFHDLELTTEAFARSFTYLLANERDYSLKALRWKFVNDYLFTTVTTQKKTDKNSYFATNVMRW